MKKYICNSAGKFESCKKCKHSKPHKPVDGWASETGDRCTEWADCDPDGSSEVIIKTRCVKVNP